jgi:hypothetical protein
MGDRVEKEHDEVLSGQASRELMQKVSEKLRGKSKRYKDPEAKQAADTVLATA